MKKRCPVFWSKCKAFKEIGETFIGAVRRMGMNIKFNHSEKGWINLSLSDYVEAKTNALKDFGYDVETQHVKEQALRVLEGEELTVIGMFMKGEIRK